MSADPPQIAALLELATFDTPDGEIRILEYAKVPWRPARDFFITRVAPEVVRGQHAHRRCWQLFRGLAGACAIRVWTPDGREFRYNLHAGSAALLVPPRRWVEVRMASPEAVLHCLCSRPYEADDYVHDRAEFDRMEP